MPSDAFTTAMTNRSIRTVKAELEFLTSVNAVSHEQLATILQALPKETILGDDSSAPTAQMANLNVRNGQANGVNEVKSEYAASPQPNYQSPPAYNPAPAGPTPLAYATAMYPYNPQDAGDLALLPNDRIEVTEYMNAEWWKGRSERTKQVGIFPRSYVRPDEKMPAPAQSNYGNMPLDVSQSGSTPAPAGPQEPNKMQEGGKKFGKKLGNAAIFGAGATIGSNIVNSIF